jgi:hypothetical protein
MTALLLIYLGLTTAGFLLAGLNFILFVGPFSGDPGAMFIGLALLLLGGVGAALVVMQLL